MNRADPWVRTRAVGRNRFWTPGLIQGLPQGSLPVPHAGVEVGWIASASCLLARLRCNRSPPDQLALGDPGWVQVVRGVPFAIPPLSLKLWAWTFNGDLPMLLISPYGLARNCKGSCQWLPVASESTFQQSGR